MNVVMVGIGGYRARLAEGEDDLRRCQRLRHLAFFERRGLARRDGERVDADPFDAICDHVMIESSATSALVASFRMLSLSDGSGIGRSYSARHYDLSRLRAFPERMVEIGRFCIHPDHRDPAILRIAWGAMVRHVEAEGVRLLFGCSSFHGLDLDAHRDAFALLKEHHLAPRRWQPGVKAPMVVPFARLLRTARPDWRLAMRRMPPLLRSYLVMGGWVSDHAVIDTELDTLHVFTGVEVSRIPKRRAETLRGA